VAPPSTEWPHWTEKPAVLSWAGWHSDFGRLLSTARGEPDAPPPGRLIAVWPDDADRIRRISPVRKLLFAAIISISAIGPMAAHAGEPLTLVQQGVPAAIAGLDRNKALAIGAGIVIGATAGSALSMRGAIIAGAVAGGLLGAWWYGERSEFATLEPRKK
jgi:hypothetical protein